MDQFGQHVAYRRLGDFTTDNRVLLLSVMGAVIGVISAFVAYALLWLIAVITNGVFYHRYSTTLPHLSDLTFQPWMIVIPVGGGLIVGLMARYGSEKIRGHGIPEAIEAILVGRSKVQPKVAFLKPTSSAIAIGTGGPFGAEGPIIMTGGAVGSLVAQFFRLSSAERKTLLVAGSAGGMTAVFNTPVAAVLIAIELLLFEWKPRSFIPVVVSCGAAALVRAPLLGTGPIFPIVPHTIPGPVIIGFAALVGISTGFVSMGITFMVYAAEDLFKRIPIHWMWWPAIGGVAIGIAGLIDMRALGVGYDTIEELLTGNAVATSILLLLVVKAVVWALALGSGTSGGVVAPLLLMGGSLGAFMSFGIPEGDIALWTMVGMAAMMGGTMGAPLTATVFVLELTHDINPFLAALMAAVAAHAVTVLVMKRSILTEKLARRGRHIAREYSVDPYEYVRVGEIMDPNPTTIPSTMTVHDLTHHIAEGHPELAHRQGFPVIDEKGDLAGIVTRSDLLRSVQKSPAGEMSVLEAGNKNLVVCYPEEPVNRAISVMLDMNIGRLIVVDSTNHRKLLGYIGRSGILATRKRLLEEENLRERVWLNGNGKARAEASEAVPPSTS